MFIDTRSRESMESSMSTYLDIPVANMTLLNNEGRFDAHATVPDDDEINTIDSAASYLRKSIAKYKESLE